MYNTWDADACVPAANPHLKKGITKTQVGISKIVLKINKYTYTTNNDEETKQ